MSIPNADHPTDLDRMEILCPICGSPDQIAEPRSPTSGGASFEYCPCCEFQFGYQDDDQGFSYSEWRGRWISQGMRYGAEGDRPPSEWNPTTQLLSVLARGEPDLIIFSGHPTPDDEDRRAASAVASVPGLDRLSRAWRKRPGDLGGAVRLFVAHVEREATRAAREAIGTATNKPEDRHSIIEMIVAGQEQSPYRQFLIERGVTLYAR
ncbi:MAG TPA: hypothetical protein VGH85_00930 [Mycobacteriales bacterium]